ncbi:S28 family serine protease [Marinitenerispora sediminis]|uniref:S28 family serine protease n=1 Tax=Marinitenerispora sediminis TaxID=1931232 RepID=UPI001F466F7A|nr:S28 family serine protease [Marinitenerispora sediminis]
MSWRAAALSLLTAAALTLSGLPAAAQTESPDIRERLEAIPGLTVVEERATEPGFRYFVLSYRQPADHTRPWRGAFEQRLTLLHRGFDRPTVLQTSGYNVRTTPARSEPTRLVDGNQVSTEQRFFTPSRPEPADWDLLTIRQAAADHHRIIRALDDIYRGAWLSTGGSKGGMTSVYHRRFYPGDLDGTIAYVAPHDVVDDEDSAYLEFFETVGDDPSCQATLADLQRESLERRAELVAYYEQRAREEGWTFDTTIGSADAAFEMLVLDTAWAFWQYQPVDRCADVPATDADTADIAAFLDEVSGFDFYTDQGTEPYIPYYYQASTQLGTPSVPTDHLDGLLRYPDLYQASSYIPDDIELFPFDRRAMPDIDRWVRTRGTELLFVNGEYDPWGAEPFDTGRGAQRRDTLSFVAPRANHGANIAQLTEADRAAATDAVRRWAGVADEVRTLRGSEYIPALDDVPEETERRPL